MGVQDPQTGFSAARFSGPRWVVVMDDDVWKRFRTQVPGRVADRLTVKLEHLAAHGEADMPRPRLRWETDPACAATQTVSIEARGTVLRGRVSVVDGRRHLFVRSITVDPIEEPAVGRRRTRAGADDRQGQLKLREED